MLAVASSRQVRAQWYVAIGRRRYVTRLVAQVHVSDSTGGRLGLTSHMDGNTATALVVCRPRRVQAQRRMGFD